MSYVFEAGKMYRMPTHFGPSTGPRQGPNGRRFMCEGTPKSLSLAVSFLTREEQLDALLPPRFSLSSEPVVTVTATYLREIEWLAGRGYNILGVTFPATFHGEVDRVAGTFLTVLWENLTDPIITGREELGFAKLYAELPEPSVLEGAYHARASWLGFTFLEMGIDGLHRQSDEEITALGERNTSAGTLHYKYIPRTGAWGTADAEYACLTPAENSNAVVQERWVGSGTVTFHRARWEDMPTQYDIVNVFHGLEVLEYRGASLTRSIGGKDLSDQRILS